MYYMYSNIDEHNVLPNMHTRRIPAGTTNAMHHLQAPPAVTWPSWHALHWQALIPGPLKQICLWQQRHQATTD